MIQWILLTEKLKEGIMQRLNIKEKFKANLKRNILITTISGGILFSGFFYYQANAVTLYNVYLDGKMIGSVSEQKVVEDWKNSQILAIKKEQGIDNLVVENSITYQKQKVFNGKFDNNKTLNVLKETVDFQAQGVEIKVAGKVIGIAKNHEAITQAINELKSTYQPTGKQKVAAASLDTAKSKVEEPKIKETIQEKQIHTDPEMILTKEELLDLLKNGTEKAEKYTVKQGDTISTIAEQFGLTSKEIYEMNPNLEGEFINIGDVLTVKTNKPLLTIATEEVLTETQSVAYQTTYENDQSLYKGQSKVTQTGQNGQKELRYSIKKENGRIIEKKLLEEKVVKAPVNQIVKKGTKVRQATKATVSRGSGSYSWPTIGGYVSSSYGTRWGRAHTGIDIARVSNPTIKAADSGRVSYVGWKNGYGKSIIIDHGNGVSTWYTHLSAYSVSAGSNVSRGQSIGTIGSTGDTTGINLHFEVRVNGSPQNPLNYISR